MFRSEPVVDFFPDVDNFGGVAPTDSDTYNKEIYLSEHNLIKFASSLA
jgi:hypothetical protein